MKLGKHKYLYLGLGAAVLVVGYLWYRRKQANANAQGDGTLGNAAPLGVINATAGSPSANSPASNSLDTSVLKALQGDISGLAQALVNYRASNDQALRDVVANAGSSSGKAGPPGPAGPPGKAAPAAPSGGTHTYVTPSNPAWGPDVYAASVAAAHSGTTVGNGIGLLK